MAILFTYIKDLYSLSRFKFVVNMALMVLLGFLEGIGILMIIPLLTVAGIIPGVQVSGGLTSWLNVFFKTLVCR